MAAVTLSTRAALVRTTGHGFNSVRTFATIQAKPHHKIVVIGAGTAGVTVAAQLARNAQLGKPDIAIIDPATTHHYQPGWTLVGTGLKPLSDMSKPLSAVVPPQVKHYPLNVATFDPENNVVKTAEGVEVSYDYLVVAPGLETNFAAVSGLPEALKDPHSAVSSIYSADTVEKVWKNIQALKGGKAIFTQPAGIIKCADAAFATGAGAMFAVPKYAAALEELRQERNVEGLFQHNLVAVDPKLKVATFKNFADGGKEPWDFVAKSALADEGGWVNVDKASTQHVKYPNVFSIGDASSLPNSKTAAAITSQAPVLVHNLVSAIGGKQGKAEYDGYASCPLITGHNELMLCEFKYGGVPQETFAGILGGQEKPRRAFYHLKKDFFPFVYWQRFVKGTWYGPKGISAPKFE
ncbi:unnamed protein product [Parascedosporium putredinis]|uniref:FAD/NAD(P)-binding domain-containing protein n=1 Tax=Parascedosporium putredinis TaxID=1442378 RepID=A0A9P1H009_9PEZI|nr:unnamed protein product [Parascedosporium putredinis]CAI7992344.1 unnamed protein product [Parascedosporium putredinis]